jgi:hypothetical protein
VCGDYLACNLNKSKVLLKIYKNMETINKENKADEILELFSENLKQHIIKIMALSGKEITNEEADTILCNIAAHILNKSLKNQYDKN